MRFGLRRRFCKISNTNEDFLKSRGIAEEGIRQGIQQGEDIFAQLMQKLFALGRTDDAKRAVEDKVYRHELMKEMLGENR
jgi:uncharacterized protein (DUF3084 family)